MGTSVETLVIELGRAELHYWRNLWRYRDQADALGISLGKVNYLLNALLEKGLVKIGAFRRSGDQLNKIAYLLTPAGLQDRTALTRMYLECKTTEYEVLKAELEALRAESIPESATTASRAVRKQGRLP